GVVGVAVRIDDEPNRTIRNLPHGIHDFGRERLVLRIDDQNSIFAGQDANVASDTGNHINVPLNVTDDFSDFCGSAVALAAVWNFTTGLDLRPLDRKHGPDRSCEGENSDRDSHSWRFIGFAFTLPSTESDSIWTHRPPS